MACLITIEEKKIATEQLNFLFKTLLMLNVYCNSTIHNFALYEKYRNKKHEKKAKVRRFVQLKLAARCHRKLK